MTPSQYIDKAIHAINTDQPNLAMLYLRKGIEVSKESRRQAMLAQPFGAVSLAYEIFADAMRSVAGAMVPVWEAVTDFSDQVQSAYALISDSEFK